MATETLKHGNEEERRSYIVSVVSKYQWLRINGYEKWPLKH